ncbi:hypothetical protein KXD93_27560 [Mucilaginibacter sp. BJC16-A38]|uniref:hypothetical protein n=1 Tax=Mucilaginibacter phenanthrenivorans TaxID=1234842 RepID=UPI002157F1E2|nr:hypothetical protein [Mucilaginibacter phenanthrenivorans]MCR8561442.1 hypothetical protein [Mucilaginibacter phenanthrenivorans]
MAVSSNPINGMPGVEIQREQTRTRIAYIALYSYIGLLTIVIVIGWWLLKLKIDEVFKILTAVAGILSGIVGAIIGFYFRDKEKD